MVGHPDPPPLEAALAAAGVGHKAYYRTPVHRQVAMRAWGAGVELPATDHAARTHLAIPLSPCSPPRRPPRSSGSCARVRFLIF